MKHYTKDFKIKVVTFYDEHPELGYLSVAREFGIKSDETVRTWVKKYQAHGEKAFDLRYGRAKGSTKKRSSWEDPKTAQERVAFLEAENAYLKKLIDLRREGK